MAAHTEARSKTATLSTTVADTVTLTNAFKAVRVTNRDAATNLFFRMDGTTAVTDADDALIVLPNRSEVFASQLTLDAATGLMYIVASIVGNANKYTFEGAN